MNDYVNKEVVVSFLSSNKEKQLVTNTVTGFVEKVENNLIFLINCYENGGTCGHRVFNLNSLGLTYIERKRK